MTWQPKRESFAIFVPLIGYRRFSRDFIPQFESIQRVMDSRQYFFRRIAERKIFIF